MAGARWWMQLGGMVCVSLASCIGPSAQPIVDARPPLARAARETPALELPEQPPQPARSKRSVLDEPDLDREITARARAALGCDWGRFGFHTECSQYKTYLAAAPSFKTPAGQRTLIRMLEDPDERVRLLATRKLWDYDAKNAETAARIVAAAERETSPVVSREMGVLAGGLDMASTATLEDVSRILRTHRLYELRTGMLSRLMLKNSGSREVLELVGELAMDANTDVAFSAVSSLHHAAKTFPDEACASLAEPLRSGRDRIVSSAAREAARLDCTKLRAEILDAADTLLTKTMADGSLVSTLESLCTSPDATAAEKSRGASLAERAVRNEKLFYPHRVDAIKAILACEPKAGVAVVKAYRGDANAHVRQAAIDRTQAGPR